MCVCVWDSRYKNIVPKKHRLLVYMKTHALFAPLVKPQDEFLPTLHLKLGLIKNFIKLMDKAGGLYLYLKDK